MLKGVCEEAKSKGIRCGECSQGQCSLDEAIPCSPTCDNLTEDGRILIEKCLASGCDALDIVLGMDDNRLTNEEIIDKYGKETEYPYYM